MSITIPDASWYKRKSSKVDAPASCPYANVHKCRRYYASIRVLGEAGMITDIRDDKKKALDAFWEDSGLSPVIAEEDTGIMGANGRSSIFTNFCPEVSYAYFNYYASFLAKYADEIDEISGHKRAEGDNIPNDWRFLWADVTACHFLDCNVYNQVHDFNSKNISKFDELVHSNILVLINRMNRCIEEKDPAGVLHAAANILETTAKDIIKDDSIENQTLGSFVYKYEKESKLPEEIKSIVGKIYNLRSKMPLSGHGSTRSPNIEMQDAVVIAAVTKCIVEIEYRIQQI